MSLVLQMDRSKDKTEESIRHKWVKRESTSSCLSFPLIVQFSFSPIKSFVTDFSAPMRASLLILYTPTGGYIV